MKICSVFTAAFLSAAQSMFIKPQPGSNTAALPLLAVFMYAFATVLMPVLILNKIFFAIGFGYALYLLITGSVRTLAPPLIALVFSFAFFLGSYGDVDTSYARQLLLSTLSLFLIYPIWHYRLDMDRVISFVGVCLAIVMVIAAGFLILAPNSAISILITQVNNHYEFGYYGERDFGGLKLFMLHHRATPFLIVPLAVILRKAFNDGGLIRFVPALVILLAIFLSASRAIMFFAFVVVFWLGFIHTPRRYRHIVLLSVTILVVFLLSYIFLATNVLSFDEKSNSIKIGHVVSYLTHLDWVNGLLGDGLASYYFSEGSGKMVSQTEITILDLLRFFGLPVTMLLIWTIIYPARHANLQQAESFYLITFVLYLLMAQSNPVLLNSFGFLVVLWYWAGIMKDPGDDNDRFTFVNRRRSSYL